MKSTTIAAISTPFGSGGIGIIRISGNRAVNIAISLFQRTRNGFQGEALGHESSFHSHFFYHGYIADPHTREIKDEVLVVAMLAPRSYTREDVVEIHSHSGPIVLEQIFKLVIGAGALIAEPGEFTKRAFLNGRIDLTQAEAVMDVIGAKTETALHIANQQLAGGLTKKIDQIRDELQVIRIRLEADIDFPEDIQEDIPIGEIIREINENIIPHIDQLLTDYKQDRFYKEGVKMAVIGRPNVGKSSLMNSLIDRDRAIVTAIAGTTRDVIEETFYIKGLPIVIMDTAGLHDADGVVEKIGIEKTRQTIKDADIILFLVDTNESLQAQDFTIYKEIADKKHIIIQNKIDLSLDPHGFELPKNWQQQPSVCISALRGTKIKELKDIIVKQVVGGTGISKEIGIIPNLRQKMGLEKCQAAVINSRRALEESLPADLVVENLNDAIRWLDKVLGNQIQGDILEQIFSRFCIGK